MRQLPLAVGLREPLDFDHFVAGDNAAALAAVRRAADALEPPLLLLGAAGTGKSHLLQAAAAVARADGRGAVYLPLGDCLDQCPPALLEGAGDTLLCIDELEHATGHRNWQLTLIRSLDAWRGRGVLVAARGLPAGLLPDLRTRLTAGARFVLQPLGESHLIEALKSRAAARGLELSDEVARFLLHRLPRRVAALLAALDALDTASLSAQRRLTVPFVAQVLGEGSRLATTGRGDHERPVRDGRAGA
ncbi:MAG: DnaA regulatory inactivator Hda [Gammaproteobacteria bacterium]|nr:DnaA regulatory inactivator Hda [Gammaproteobacteria bacterium]